METSTHISETEFGDLNSALSWAVQTYDNKFTGSNMTSLHVEQVQRFDEFGVRYVWTASVHGTTDAP